MPRKKLIYTHEYPYHIMAYSQKKESFYVDKEVMWYFLISCLNQIVIDFKVHIHAFVLMDNHYQMIISMHKKSNLGVVMQRLQKSISRKVNSKSGRINHVFGGPYKACLIKKTDHYSQIYKHIYRKPIETGLCDNINSYKYCTLNTDLIPICSPISGVANDIPTSNIEDWINKEVSKVWSQSISKGLCKTLYKPVYPR